MPGYDLAPSETSPTTDAWIAHYRHRLDNPDAEVRRAAAWHLERLTAWERIERERQEQEAQTAGLVAAITGVIRLGG